MILMNYFLRQYIALTYATNLCQLVYKLYDIEVRIYNFLLMLYSKKRENFFLKMKYYLGKKA